MTGVTDVDRLRIRDTAMNDGIDPFEYREVDCSGRSLATLMVAWVGAAMVASVLLRWKYMWIALTILTFIFLFACGYAACNARKAHERIMAREEARILERRRRDRNIQSVSSGVDNCPEITDPPAYQAYWITDLPPPYAVVIGAESSLPPPPPPMPRSLDLEPTTSTSGYSNPPPYHVATQSDLNDNSQTSNQTLRTIVHSVETSSLSSDRRNTSFDEPTNLQMDQVVTVSSVAWDDDIKIASQQTRNDGENSSSNNTQTVLSSGTQYLSNIISCTFGRGQRRNNAERNSSLQTTTMTTMRDRLGVSQLNNQDNAISSSRISASTL